MNPKRWKTLAPCVPLLFLAAPSAAQEYWEQESWSGDWEYHEPIEGRKTTYEWDWNQGWVVEDVERQEYEWEAGEGYHEEEWYDPSDWFDATAGVEYEYDWDTWGADYDYGLGYEPYDAFEYGYDWDPYEGVADPEYGLYDDLDSDDFGRFDRLDYDRSYTAARSRPPSEPSQQQGQQGQQAALPSPSGAQPADRGRPLQRGEVVGLRRIRGASYGAPEQVVLDLRMQDGATRSVTLGDVGYVTQYLPSLEQGDRIAVGGRTLDVDGRQVFKAEEIRSRDSQFRIPEYEYRRTLRGELVGLRQVRTRGGDVTAVVAEVRDARGNTRDVLLGNEDALRGIGTSIRPNAQVQVEGYHRSVDGRDAFVVQNVTVLDRAQQRMQPARAQRDEPGMRARQASQPRSQQPDRSAQPQGSMQGQDPQS